MKNATLYIDRYKRICHPLTGKTSYENVFYRGVALHEERFSVYAPHGRAINIFNTKSALRFISCGRGRIESIAFLDLIKAFDGYIWVFASMSMIALVPVIQQIIMVSRSSRRLGEMSQLGSLWKDWISLVKVCLEQGDPFPLSLLRDNHVRLVVSCVLLVGIVLSNAYKNTNVCNMIAPREPIPYQRLNELILNNFTIYSRIGRVDLSPFSSFQVRDPFEINVEKHVMTAITIRDAELHNELMNEAKPEKMRAFAAVTSEILTLIDTSKLENSNGSIDDSNNSYGTELMMTVSNNSNLHPSLTSAIVNRLKQVHKVGYLTAEKYEAPDYLSSFSNLVAQDEEEILEEFMEQCNKTALVLPYFMCQQHNKRLHQIGRRNVYVGKEIYNKPSFSFTLSGIMPPYVVKRLSGMGASGLWEWWMKLIQDGSGLSTYRYSKAVRKPTLDGNILVIYALLSVGLFVALLVFLVENRQGFYSLAVKGIHYVKQRCYLPVSKGMGYLGFPRNNGALNVPVQNIDVQTVDFKIRRMQKVDS
ncbi:unnamed protein product [Orchesella dallaii]|uniref:Uncharacterized protein n=1 Tax=Orchesella dallaii TaxID=48710 RepID=A0ABP1RTY2_9HEXA